MGSTAAGHEGACALESLVLDTRGADAYALSPCQKLAVLASDWLHVAAHKILRRSWKWPWTVCRIGETLSGGLLLGPVVDDSGARRFWTMFLAR